MRNSAPSIGHYMKHNPPSSWRFEHYWLFFNRAIGMKVSININYLRKVSYLTIYLLFLPSVVNLSRHIYFPLEKILPLAGLSITFCNFTSVGEARTLGARTVILRDIICTCPRKKNTYHMPNKIFQPPSFYTAQRLVY